MGIHSTVLPLSHVMVTAPDASPGHVFPFPFCFSQNLLELVAHQAHQKQLQALREGKYKVLCHNEEACTNQQEKLQGRLQTINSIVQQIHEEQPQHQRALQWLRNSLGSRLGVEKA